MKTEMKDRLPLRMEPETKRKIDQWYQTDHYRSKNEFVEKAVNFYADYLAANDNDILPTAISSAIDGRLDQFEDRIAKLLFKLAVATDMNVGVLADVYNFTEDGLRRRRATSVQNVKQTNGILSLEQQARDVGDE